MYKQKRILAVIPARGGSKRVVRKNIRELCGRPLIAYAIAGALENPFIDKVIVSTDDGEIAAIAKNCGAEVPFLRPHELAEDTTPDGPVFRHAINFLDAKNDRYDYVINLRPTTPLRGQEDITNIIAAAVENNYALVRSVTVAEGDNHPYWMYEGFGGALKPLFPDKSINIYYQRQLLPRNIFMLNAVVDIFSHEQVCEAAALYEADPMGYVEVPKERAVDINNDIDFSIAEVMMDRYRKNK